MKLVTDSHVQDIHHQTAICCTTSNHRSHFLACCLCAVRDNGDILRDSGGMNTGQDRQSNCNIAIPATGNNECYSWGYYRKVPE